MRASLAGLLQEAAGRGAAVAGFTCYNAETALGVLRAAEERGAGVVLLVSPGSFRARGGPLLTAALAALADRASAPACVQLDHVDDLGLIEAAFAAGAGAVMADGGSLPAADNTALVQAAVEVARRFGGDVEAELGRIEGEEDVAVAAAAGALTDPGEAERFVADTGAACLAVSIGNVHGAYRRPPDLDWARLEAIRGQVSGPLSLHGASGLPDADLRRAVRLGVTKFNVNTEVRERYLAVTSEQLERVRRGARLLELNLAQAEAVADVASAKLALSEPGPSAGE